MINTEEKNKKAVGEILIGISWMTVMLCCMAFFMGRIQLFGGFYTLGIGYIGAMYSTSQTRRWGHY